MDEAEVRALKKQGLEPPRPLDAELIKGYTQSPQWKLYVSDFRKRVVSQLAEQLYSGRFATVFVKRTGTKVTVRWKEKGVRNGIHTIHVDGTFRVIEFTPDADDLTMVMIANGVGDGEVIYELEEGRCYSFYFLFIAGNPLDKVDMDSLDTIHCIVGVPLSDTNLRLLKKARLIDENPEERIKDDLDIILRKRGAYNKKLRECIERIKALGLPPDEEQQAIEDFRDEAKSIEDKHGL